MCECVRAAWQLMQHSVLPGTSTAKCFLHFDRDEKQIYYFHFGVFVLVTEEALSIISALFSWFQHRQKYSSTKNKYFIFKNTFKY